MAQGAPETWTAAERSRANLAAMALVAELKRVQDAIGTWHDWATLGERAAGVLDDAGVPVVVGLREDGFLGVG